MLKPHFTQLLQYDYWANTTMLQAYLSSNVADPTISKWLNHIVNAQVIWHGRLAGAASSRGVWDMLPDRELPPEFERSHQNWQALLEGLSEENLSETIPYQNSRGDVFQNQRQDIIAHVVNHGTHHRAQVAARLREAGVVPPATDYIFWKR